MGQYYIAINSDTMEWIQPHDFDNGAKLMEHSYLTNNFVEAVEFLLLDDGEDKSRWAGQRIVWAGDYADPEAKEGETLYESSQDKDKLGMLIEAIPPNYYYLVNWDRQEFVDKTKCKPINGNWNVNEMKVHPLPLLTAEGNGRGGGDYHGNSMELIGTWARDRISVMKEPPIGFTEIIPNFTTD
jgi:hypothetical protein